MSRRFVSYLGVDARKSDQLYVFCSASKGTGKSVRVAVFAQVMLPIQQKLLGQTLLV